MARAEANEASPVSDDLLRLESQLCFMLYSASRKMTAAYRPLLSELGLTYPQYLVLMVLWEFFDLSGRLDDAARLNNREAGMKVGALSSKLQLDNGTLTPLLKRLEHQGLVTRIRDKADERVVRVFLTEKGTVLRSQACQVPLKLMRGSGLDRNKMRTIYSELSQVLHKIPGVN